MVSGLTFCYSLLGTCRTIHELAASLALLNNSAAFWLVARGVDAGLAATKSGNRNTARGSTTPGCWYTLGWKSVLFSPGSPAGADQRFPLYTDIRYESPGRFCGNQGDPSMGSGNFPIVGWRRPIVKMPDPVRRSLFVPHSGKFFHKFSLILFLQT